MLSRQVLEDCDVELLLMSFPGQPASLFKLCWVTALRFVNALSGEIICVDVCTSLYVHAQSPILTQRSHICGKGAVGRGSESVVLSQDCRTVIQEKQKRQRVHHLVGWLKSCRCTSPIKKEKPFLAWRCRGGSRGCSVTRLTAAVLYKSYSVQIF